MKDSAHRKRVRNAFSQIIEKPLSGRLTAHQLGVRELYIEDKEVPIEEDVLSESFSILSVEEYYFIAEQMIADIHHDGINHDEIVLFQLMENLR